MNVLSRRGRKDNRVIPANATITVRILPISCLQVREYQVRYPKQLKIYRHLLRTYPKDYAGIVHVIASDTHEGMYAILDGYTRFCASIMEGRSTVLCAIIAEE